jgi:peptidyl-tRNA hydrolase
MAPEHYVLQPFHIEEEKALPEILERACGAIKVMITEDIQKAMSQYHSRSAIKN